MTSTYRLKKGQSGSDRIEFHCIQNRYNLLHLIDRIVKDNLTCTLFTHKFDSLRLCPGEGASQLSHIAALIPLLELTVSSK